MSDKPQVPADKPDDTHITEEPIGTPKPLDTHITVAEASPDDTHITSEPA
jgi:hypothetical protein